MKTRVILSIGLLSLIGASHIFAQQVEHDDMYFTSKDRAKLREVQKANEVVMASAKKNKKAEVKEAEENLNPTDSYSARNVNPEYTSRSNSQTAKDEEADYYVNNYQYEQYQRNNYNNWNNNFDNWYRGSWYSSNYWGPSINSWNSPYYGYYDSWNSPWYDPYWSYNGWSSSFSFHYGNSWNYGWGGSYNYWNRPYCAYNSYYGYGSGFGYGSNWYWNNYRNPQTVIIVNNGESAGKGISYGKRPTRGSAIGTRDAGSDSRSRSGMENTPGRGNNDGTSGGRISNNRNPEYYNRTWRNSDSNTNTVTPTNDSRRSTENNRPSYWNNNSNNSSNNTWERSSTNTNSTYTPSRSSSDGGSSMRSQPSPSSGNSSSGSSSGNRSRRD